MTDDNATGTGIWCWHDLMTTDLEASTAFYGELFGWEIRPIPMGPMTYHMIHVGERGIGGLVALEAEAGIPSHWIGYVTTDDVDACAERAAANGGEICVPAQDIPGVGRFAVIKDPSGACFSAFKSAEGQEWTPPENPAAEGLICWNELLTDDVDSAKRFYGEVVGWNFNEVDMGPMGVYVMPQSDGQDRGGMMAMPPESGGPPNWVAYVAVDDVDGKHGQAVTAGAQTFVPPTDIPGIGRFAVLADPGGATFALYKSTGAPCE